MRPPEVLARAPGRVNLIGEHTDHQEGFVLPLAIGLGTTVRARARDDRRFRVSSAAFGSATEFERDAPPAAVAPSWARIPAAVLSLLVREGLDLPGLDAAFSGDLPVGAGLSSSASTSVALALAAIELTRAAGRPVSGSIGDRGRLAALCRDAEALGAGVRCGIMDPFASLHGRAGAALLLDCRTLDVRTVPIPADRVAFVVADSGVRRTLAAGDYGRRREECEDAARRLGVRSLRDATLASVDAALGTLGPLLARRARHVVAENARVLAAERALRDGDVAELGRLLSASHASLRDDFEVSCPELDRLVETALRVPGVLGSRMTGAGFGGVTLTAVAPAAVPKLIAAFAAAGRRALGRDVPTWVVVPSEGASVNRT